MPSKPKPKYPEHAKLEKVKDKSETIGAFIEWLRAEGNLVLAEWYTHEERGAASGRLFSSEQRLRPSHESINKILARYFDIDLDALSTEKDKMLAELRFRRANARRPSP